MNGMRHGALGLDRSMRVRALLAPVAARIRCSRRERQLTLRAVARHAGMRPCTLRRVEAGEQGITAAAIGRVALALGIDEEELYPGGRPGLFWSRLGTQMRCVPQPKVAAELLIAA